MSRSAEAAGGGASAQAGSCHVLPSAATAGATAGLPPPATSPVGQTSLVDVLLCDFRQGLTLFSHAAEAQANRNVHALELLAAALAMHLRLHGQAAHDVLCPLLERRCGADGAQAAARCRQHLQTLEWDVLEILTLRTERSWKALAERINRTHQDFAAHAHDVELAVLPRLAADMRAEELRAAGVLLQQQKQAASLAPQVQEP